MHPIRTHLPFAVDADGIIVEPSQIVLVAAALGAAGVQGLQMGGKVVFPVAPCGVVELGDCIDVVARGKSRIADRISPGPVVRLTYRSELLATIDTTARRVEIYDAHGALVAEHTDRIWEQVCAAHHERAEEARRRARTEQALRRSGLVQAHRDALMFVSSIEQAALREHEYPTSL